MQAKGQSLSCANVLCVPRDFASRFGADALPGNVAAEVRCRQGGGQAAGGQTTGGDVNRRRKETKLCQSSVCQTGLEAARTLKSKGSSQLCRESVKRVWTCVGLIVEKVE